MERDAGESPGRVASSSQKSQHPHSRPWAFWVTKLRLFWYEQHFNFVSLPIKIFDKECWVINTFTWASVKSPVDHVTRRYKKRGAKCQHRRVKQIVMCFKKEVGCRRGHDRETERDEHGVKVATLPKRSGHCLSVVPFSPVSACTSWPPGGSWCVMGYHGSLNGVLQFRSQVAAERLLQCLCVFRMFVPPCHNILPILCYF